MHRDGIIQGVCFNTQPPEGGWSCYLRLTIQNQSFNTQPPEGGWNGKTYDKGKNQVSTHSRLKAAGYEVVTVGEKGKVSTHSRLKAAGTTTCISGWPALFQHTAA